MQTHTAKATTGWLLSIMMVALFSAFALSALAEERATTPCRVTILRDSGTTTANCVLVRRDGAAPGTTLYFVTVAHVFKDTPWPCAAGGSIHQS